MSGIITLGIGPKATISQFILFGLGASREQPAAEEAVTGAGQAAHPARQPKPSAYFAKVKEGMLRPRPIQNPSPTVPASAVVPQAPRTRKIPRPRKISLDQQLARGLGKQGELDVKSVTRTIKTAMREFNLKPNSPEIASVIQAASRGDNQAAFAALDSAVGRLNRAKDLELRKIAAIESRKAEKVEAERQVKEAKANAKGQEIEHQRRVEAAKAAREVERQQAIGAQRELEAKAEADKAAAVEARESEKELLKQLRKELKK